MMSCDQLLCCNGHTHTHTCKGEEVLSGARTPMTLTVMRSEQPAIFDTLMHIQNLVEKHFRDMQVQYSTVGDAETYYCT